MRQKYWIVGLYSDGLCSLLAFPGSKPDTLDEARRRIRWQTQGPGGDTQWFICTPADERGVMLDRETGRRLTLERGALTAEAHERLMGEIWNA